MKLRAYIGLALAAMLAGGLDAEWPTFGHDSERSNWAPEETKITPETVKTFELKWSVQLDNAALALNALTAPVVARDVVTEQGIKTLVYTAGSSNHLFAIDAATGKVVWTRTFQSYVTAKEAPFFLCPNALNATPVVDRQQNLIFALALDGRLFGLDLGTGSIRFGPYAFVPPLAKAWSLNLNNGYIYTTTSQGCGGDRPGIYSMSVSDPAHHVSYEMLAQYGTGAGMWSRGGTAIGRNGLIYASTGDGKLDPPNGNFGSSYLAARAPDLTIADYYSPLNWDEVNKRDLDLPAGGLAWFGYRNWHLIVGGGKESVVYLLDADALGDKDHQTPLYVSEQIGNEGKELQEKGIWGSPAVWKDERGEPWIYVPVWGAPAKRIGKQVARNGDAPHGSIMAFRVELDAARRPCLRLAWISPDVNLPDAPAIANGVVFVVATGENPRQTRTEGMPKVNVTGDWRDTLLTTEEREGGTHAAVLMALDAKTGKLLFESGTAMKSWNHFGGLAIDDGKVYAVDHASNLYCFGAK
ncbi:MAG TPA: PQQ-binding-like beta-propeller repeat protein [Bryobacteraceae bacterium]|jgi:outer membrane protein assembly factor BamB|nr:PQQ-binding-like beta-propeller repeat protein [Bryobacteraceae bacterium]